MASVMHPVTDHIMKELAAVRAEKTRRKI